MRKTSSLVALLTDLGLDDHYVGVMKGVILGRAPEVNIVDISHNVSPQNIDQAAYLLWASYKYFPQGTIFVNVVDPGVGSKRSIICATGHGYSFLAPDNGLLKYILGDLPNMKIFSITEKKYFLPAISSTFHGRDIFAPVAAHLANRLPPSKLGNPVQPDTHPEKFLTINMRTGKKIEGRIIHVDRFGNLVTNFQPKRSIQGLKKYYLELDSRNEKRRTKHIIQNYYRTYADAPFDVPFMTVGSSGLIEISLKNGNAAERLQAKQGSTLTLHTQHV